MSSSPCNCLSAREAAGLTTESGDREKLLLRVREACFLTSVSVSLGYQLARSGEWPTVRIGRSVRIPFDGLVHWIDQQAI
jgi:excisionase family DNA binding protein